MARSLSEQLQAFTQQQQQLQTMPSQGSTTIDQVVTLIQNQDRKFQALTDMVASMMTMADTTNAKRSPDEINESFDSNIIPATQIFGQHLDRGQRPSKQVNTKDTECNRHSPSHMDHKEMDLSDDSSTPGSALDSSHASGREIDQHQNHD